jgi:hypothetical protein
MVHPDLERERRRKKPIVTRQLLLEGGLTSVVNDHYTRSDRLTDSVRGHYLDRLFEEVCTAELAPDKSVEACAVVGVARTDADRVLERYRPRMNWDERNEILTYGSAHGSGRVLNWKR